MVGTWRGRERGRGVYLARTRMKGRFMTPCVPAPRRAVCVVPDMCSSVHVEAEWVADP
jgi:hypothetical protein